ncbi:hypothetical protein J1N35_010725 [Gossypium stocksii]|uniref:Thioesterase domain-containing protein n=1 Tax=Gossypium stocksii TaxID=47602 RepID=A0A9D3W1K9_9ROSI|nr:hypothetical protein J1N35_010725 [Gossypium stocksii]
MANPSSIATAPGSRELQTSSSSPGGAATSTKSDDRANPFEPQVMGFFKRVGMHDPNVENYSSRDFYSNLLCNTLKTHTVRRGHVTCFATVTPAVANYFGGLHGGAVAAIAERVAIATTRTVVGEDKEIFLVDLGMSYLSAAPKDVSSSGFLISHFWLNPKLYYSIDSNSRFYLSFEPVSFPLFSYVEKDLAGKDRIICMES